MNRLWEILYSYIFIPLFWAIIRTLGMFDKKVRRGIAGRKNLFQDLAAQMAAVPPGTRIWFHSSSMGEFEQAKPIIAALKRRNPNVRIIVTFFSPSGYEHSRTYKLADVISYLPFDSLKGAQRFIQLVKPDVAVMVRYDIWPNHIWELRRHNIPTIIANATMSRRTLRRLPVIRSFHRHVYESIDAILTVSETDVQAFGILIPTHPNVQVIGDTRFDQVSIRSSEARKRNIIPPHILEKKKVVAIGSSWPEDEEVVLPAFLQLQKDNPDLLLILVPHEPTVEHLEDIEQQLAGRTDVLRFSALNEYNGERIILVDSIGILLILYASAHIAYVGGSFRQGIHNVLEAAVYGIPVLFGPKHRNSHEPLLLVERGGAFVINDSRELTRLLQNLLADDSARTTAGERAARFVQSNVGATDRFLAHLQPYLSQSTPDEKQT